MWWLTRQGIPIPSACLSPQNVTRKVYAIMYKKKEKWSFHALISKQDVKIG